MKAIFAIFVASLSGFASAQQPKESFPKEYQEDYRITDLSLECFKYYKELPCFTPKYYLYCNINYNRSPSTSKEDHIRCEKKSERFFNQCEFGPYVCTGRAVNGYKVCTGTQDYWAWKKENYGHLANPATPNYGDGSNQAESAKADASEPKGSQTDGVGSNQAKPDKADASEPKCSQTDNATKTPELNPEIEKNKAFQQCIGSIMPNNPCVRELFYLQGSVDRFRWNCFYGDLAEDQVRYVSLAHYPKGLFPNGPKCGTVQNGAVQLTPSEYKPVCDKCVGPVFAKSASGRYNSMKSHGPSQPK